MSQKVVYNLIKELGNSATIPQILKLAKQKDPKTTISYCIWKRIDSLRNMGYIDYDKHHRGIRSTRIYEIIADFPEIEPIKTQILEKI